MKLSNAEIKRLKSLHQKKFRDEEGLFIVEGDKLVKEAMASGLDVLDVFRRDEIGEECMARISALTSPSPVLAVVRKPRALSDAEIAADISNGMLAIGLDAVRDPGNLGTIIRISDWFGIDAIFASEDTVELYNPKVVQSTMGAIFRKKVVYCDLCKVCDMFASSGMNVYGTFLEGEDIYGMELGKQGLVIMGNESNGISDAVREKVNAKLVIPSFAGDGPCAESLNVAIATAITMSEFRRR